MADQEQNNRQVENTYLGRIAALSGRPAEDFTTPDVRSTRIDEIRQAFGALEANSKDYIGYVEKWDRNTSAGIPTTDLPPALSDEDMTLIDGFIPGKRETSEVPSPLPPDQLIRKSRRVVAVQQGFLLEAAGLLNTQAKSAHEPGQNAPGYLTCLPIWYELYRNEHPQRDPTKHLMVGTASARSAESLLNILRRVDPGAELTAIDLEPLTSRLPGEGRRDFRFQVGNAFDLEGEFNKRSFDGVHMHRLVFNRAQLQHQPPSVRDIGDIGRTYVLDRDRDEKAAEIYKQVYKVLRDEGVFTDIEPIDWRDEEAKERVIGLLIAAEFKRDDIFIFPAEQFAKRRLTDDFLAGDQDINAFRAEKESKGEKLVVDDEPGSALIVALKVESEEERRARNPWSRR